MSSSSSSSNKWKWKWKWKKRNNNVYFIIRSPIILTISILTSLLLIFFFFNNYNNSNYSISLTNYHSALPPLCTPNHHHQQQQEEKFVWYAPHSGFTNQLLEFKNAILMASILNRTLIVPPILDHHSVALGSCPKFRVLNPNHIRFSVWNHSISLLRHRRYISMADIVDLSELASDSAVRFIDFRVFVSVWCGVNLEAVCSKNTTTFSSISESLRQCGSLLSGYSGNVHNCVYATTEDCRSTIWTYQNDEKEGALDSFQPSEELKKKKKISYARRRKDVYKALGPGSKAESAQVLGFGSLFTAPYKGTDSHIDIHEAPNDQRIQSLIDKIEYLPYVSEITSAGKKFAAQMSKAPFLCAQLRLLDGQFKYHWKQTFLGLKEELESMKQKGPLPISVFVMTDLPMGNWTGTYLGDIAKETDTYKLFVLRENDELVEATAKEIVNAGHGMKLGCSIEHVDEMEKHCRPQTLPDTLLYLEGTVCSCGSLGFVGTAGSTIAESIKVMRKHHSCSVRG